MRKHLILTAGLLLIASAASAGGFPTAGEVHAIDAEINTNLVLGGQVFPVNTYQKRHSVCDVVQASTTGFNTNFMNLRADFDDSSLGSVTVALNPEYTSVGNAVSESDSYPATSTVQLHLQIQVGDVTLVNHDPVVIQAEINQWPPIGSTYQAITGAVDLYHAGAGADSEPVAQIYGSQITVFANTGN